MAGSSAGVKIRNFGFDPVKLKMSLGHLHGNFMLCRYKNLSLEVR